MDSVVDPFVAAVNEVLGEEAGYVNNPADPGGETKWGISKRAFPSVDIVNLTREQASALYRTNYWNPLLQYTLDPQFRLVAFECAVNQGLARCRSLIEVSKGQLSWFMAERALSYASDKAFVTFGRGWLRRLFKEVTST